MKKAFNVEQTVADLTAEKSELLRRVEAINKILDACYAFNGNAVTTAQPAQPAKTGKGSGKGNRKPRSAATKAKIAAAVKAAWAKKNKSA